MLGRLLGRRRAGRAETSMTLVSGSTTAASSVFLLASCRADSGWPTLQLSR